MRRSLPLLTRRISTTTDKDHAAISQCFLLTNRVTRLLERFPGQSLPHPPSLVGPPRHSVATYAAKQSSILTHLETLLKSFRSSAQNDGSLKLSVESGYSSYLSLQKHLNVSLGNLTLSSQAIIVSVDTGGEEENVSDVGVCIYDNQSNSIYMIQVDIRGRRLSRRGSVLNNLLARPLKLDVEQAGSFINILLHYFLDHKPLLGHDVCIVGHNLERDLKALRSLGVHIQDNVTKIDTDILCRETLFSRGVNLRRLALTLGLKELKPFHPSVNDAYYTLHVFLRMVNTPQFQNIPIGKLQENHITYMTKIHRRMEED